jgi:hypothetical protein
MGPIIGSCLRGIFEHYFIICPIFRNGSTTTEPGNKERSCPLIMQRGNIKCSSEEQMHEKPRRSWVERDSFNTYLATERSGGADR